MKQLKPNESSRVRMRIWKPPATWLPMAVIVLAAACTTVTNPATGESELTTVTPAQERAIGAQEHPKVVAEFGGEYFVTKCEQ